jgi:hypothetical protein
MMLGLLLFLAAALQSPAIVDSDHDGLSDFDEIHKYFTDPQKPDTDGDGITDGDWQERREYAYSVHAVIKVLPPVNVGTLNDDYQDARVLESRPDYVEIEVVCYPLNTVAASIGEDPDWRAHAAQWKPWIDPGPTCNWDADMQRQMHAELTEARIDERALSDKALVEKVSKWLLQRSQTEDSFTTFAVDFVDGRPRIAPGMEGRVATELAKTGRTLPDQWLHELYGKGMFANRVHGSCTSSAVYISTAFRALGLPARTVLCIPVIDASDPHEVELVKKGIRHNGVRRTMLREATKAGTSWTSHTFNEVVVDGCWRRLNYDRLGQNILDPEYLGLMVHVNTYGDLADAGLSSWGLRSARGERADAFGGSNPYSCVDVSDSFGVHANVANPELPEHHVLTISRLYWHGDPKTPESVLRDKPQDPLAGPLLAHVDEVLEGESSGQYADFFAQVDKHFVLRAAGRADVSATCQGWWFDHDHPDVREFYIVVPPKEFAHMQRNVAYTLVPVNSATDDAWKVRDGVTITRP